MRRPSCAVANGAALLEATSRWSVGRLAPLVLAAWLAVDVGARFLPLDWFRIPVLLQAVRVPGPDAPFRSNLRLRTTRYGGESALAANRPVTERRPPLAFSTDALGFRRNPYLAPGAPAGVLFLLGASYAYGAGLSDEERSHDAPPRQPAPRSTARCG